MKATKMATDGGSLPQRPQFFKILFPTPSTKLKIPKKFHTHLPSELPKIATFLCPHAEFWHVEICQDDGDVIFQKGWSEFSKAHDLCTGYLLLFQYNGNMNFEVKVFDTSCCLKDYPLKHCTRKDPSCIIIEDSSDDEDTTLTDTSHGITNDFTKDSYKRPAYIEIEESSESEDQKISKEHHEISVNSFSEKRKSATSDGNEKQTSERDIQTKVKSKILKTNQETANIKQFEKILTASMVSCNMIKIPRVFCINNDLAANRTFFLKRKIEGKVVHNEWRVGFFSGSGENRIRNGWRAFSKDNNLKIGDKCSFKLVSKDTFVVEIEESFNSIGAKRKYVNGRLPGVSCEENRPSRQQHNALTEQMRGSSCKGPAYVKIKDLSEFDSEVISRVSDGGTEIPGNYFSKRRKLPNSKIKEEQEQKDGHGKKRCSTKKEVPAKLKDPRNNLQCERIIKRYHLSYMSLPKTFCMANGLINRCQTIFLRSSTHGKSWPVQFYFRKSDGRLHAGWKGFATKNELKVGDQCTFKLMPKNILQVNIVRKCRKEMLSPQNWKSEMQSNGSEISLIVRQYHLTHNYMSIPMSFCLKSNLSSSRQISLKSPDGKVWHMNFYLNRSKEGRFNRVGWKTFAFENGLRVGDKCLLKLVALDTLLVQVAKA